MERGGKGFHGNRETELWTTCAKTAVKEGSSASVSEGREVLVSENQETGWDQVTGANKGSLPQPCHLLRSTHTSLDKTKQINFTRPWFMKLHNECMQWARKVPRHRPSDLSFLKHHIICSTGKERFLKNIIKEQRELEG